MRRSCYNLTDVVRSMLSMEAFQEDEEQALTTTAYRVGGNAGLVLITTVGRAGGLMSYQVVIIC